jgi:DNA-binding NarL/FixJ family response regulator
MNVTECEPNLKPNKGMNMKANHRFSFGIVSGLPENIKPYNGSSPVNQIGQLSSREIEVLQLIARGKLNKQAASELSISIKTVEKHRENLMKKLGIHGIACLTHFAIYAGIVPCSPQMAFA